MPFRPWLLSCLLMLPACLAADDAVLVLGVTPEGNPPYYMGEQSDFPEGGIFPDVLRRLAAGTGRRVEVHRYPRNRLEEKLLAGDVDVVPLAREWVANKERFHFTAGVVEARDVVLVPAAATAQTLADLYGRHISTRRGYYYPSIAAALQDGRLLREDVDSEAAILQMVLLQRTAGGVINRLSANWLVRHNNWHGRLRPVHLLDPVEYRYMLRRSDAALAQALDRALAGLKRDGTLAQLLAPFD